MSGRFSRILSGVRRHGLPAYVKRYVNDRFRRLFSRQVSTVFVLRRDVPIPMDRVNAALTVTEASFPVDARLQCFIDEYLPRKLFEQHVSDGWRLMVARADDAVLGLSWFRMDSIYVESVGALLAYGGSSGYIEGTLTGKDARGKGVAPAVRVRICETLRALGAREIYVCAGDDNPASQAVARKCGFVPHERLDFRRFAGFSRLGRSAL